MSSTGGRAPIALIVDDDPMMRLLIRQALERVGFVCDDAKMDSGRSTASVPGMPTSSCST